MLILMQLGNCIVVHSNTFFTGWLTLWHSFRTSAVLRLRITNYIAMHLAIHRNVHSDVCILFGVTIDPTVYVSLEF